MISLLLSLATFLVTTETVKQSLLMSITCSEYMKCMRNLKSVVENCDEMENGVKRPPNAFPTIPSAVPIEGFCAKELRPKYAFLTKLMEGNRLEVSACIKTSIGKGLYIDEEKQHYCSVHMNERFAQTKDIITSKECWKSAKSVSTRCMALLKCCAPASRCESEAKHTNVGKTISALRDEMAIRLAECKQSHVEKSNQSSNKKVALQQEEGVRTVVTVDISPRNSTIPTRPTTGIKKLPPLAPPIFNKVDVNLDRIQRSEQTVEKFCTRYLNCINDLHLFRHKCNAINGIPRRGEDYLWSVSYLQLTKPLDHIDASCLVLHEELVKEVHMKQEKTDAYMRSCVKEVNATAELIKQDRTCTPAQIADVPFTAPNVNSCRTEASVRKFQCLMLWDCCPHADVCERTPMYAVLSDDYLSSLYDLRDSMNKCYHNNFKKQQTDAEE